LVRRKSLIHLHPVVKYIFTLNPEVNDSPPNRPD